MTIATSAADDVIELLDAARDGRPLSTLAMVVRAQSALVAARMQLRRTGCLTAFGAAYLGLNHDEIVSRIES